MSNTTTTRTEVLRTIEALTGQPVEPVHDDPSSSLIVRYGEEQGIITFRDRDGEDIVSIRIFVAVDLPDDDIIFRFVATHAYLSESIGTINAAVGDDGVMVTVGHPIPLKTCTEAHLAEVLDALIGLARDARADLPLWGDPYNIAPSNAWLVTADENSYLSDEDLEVQAREVQRHGFYSQRWTASARTRFGDLLLIYYLSPRKAVHYVARAASDAYFDANSDVGALSHIAKAQWWVDLTPPVAIDPIDFATLQHATGGRLILQGRSGKYLRPDEIAALSFTALNSNHQEELDMVTETPVGLADLTAPETMTMDEWRNVAAGALELEEQVSEYLVEPLVRLVAPQLTLEPQVRVDGAGIADYVVREAGGQGPARCVIEVKQSIDLAKSGSVEATRAFAQLRRYQTVLGLPGILIDAHRVIAVAPDGTVELQVSRADFGRRATDRLARHMTGADA